MANSSSVELSKKEINDYIETVHALLCFSHLWRWDNENKKFFDNSAFFIGRRMDTSKNNRILPNNDITPDLIIQMNGSYGLVGEVKVTFPNNQEYWKEDFRQLQKYDDNLKGWTTANEFIPKNDVVLLTELTKKNRCVDYLKEKISIGEITFKRPFSVIAFSEKSMAKLIMYLEKSYGDLSDPVMNEALRQGQSMPMHRFLPIYKIKFYDQPPPLPYLMCILWEDIFSQLASQEDLMRKRGYIIQIEVNCQNITEMLKNQFSLTINHDDRQPEIPKKAWVKEALEKFVELGYGENKSNSNEDFTINWQNIGHTIDKFIIECVEGKRIAKKIAVPQKTKRTSLSDFSE